jgi:toxin ParE1/3/4
LIRLEFSPEATADLADIGAYIASDDPGRARSFVDELEARCASLIEYPDTGRPRPELAQDLRSKPHGHYLIFYTPCAEASGSSAFCMALVIWRKNSARTSENWKARDRLGALA